MTLEQIKQAVEFGETVHWATDSYKVVHDKLGQWLVVCDNGSCVGLTDRDGVLQGRPEQFYIKSMPNLLEAAPDLLQVVEDYVLLCELHGLVGAVPDAARAAIKKAKGE
jgi:hypothetical protein